jgi:hypothetical protein
LWQFLGIGVLRSPEMWFEYGLEDDLKEGKSYEEVGRILFRVV